MTSMSFTAFARSGRGTAPAPRRPLARTARLVRRGWQAYWERRARKATVAILRSLDCRTLHDIGIHPSEIDSLVYAGRDRCRRYDTAWLWRGGGAAGRRAD
jgi:uncharacterized protein YjiS (DUF1127 family)